MKKNEDFEKRLSALEDKVFSIKKEDKEIKKENDFEKFENFSVTRMAMLHTSYITNIIFLQNDRIAMSSFDNKISIYNKDTFEVEYYIKEKSKIDWIEQIKDGTLISCLRDNTIKLYEINENISYKLLILFTILQVHGK